MKPFKSILVISMLIFVYFITSNQGCSGDSSSSSNGSIRITYNIQSSGNHTTRCYTDSDNNFSNGVGSYSVSNLQTGPSTSVQTISDVPAGSYYVHCWFDTDDSGALNTGDDLGTSTTTVTVVSGSITTEALGNLTTQ